VLAASITRPQKTVSSNVSVVLTASIVRAMMAAVRTSETSGTIRLKGAVPEEAAKFLSYLTKLFRFHKLHNDECGGMIVKTDE
jgi:hypothetical protein